MRTAEKYRDHRVISLSAQNLCFVHTHKGELNRAIEYGELAIKEAPTPFDHTLARVAKAAALCRAGDAKGALQELVEIVQAYRAGHLVSLEILATPYLAEAYLRAQLYDQATRHAEDLIQLAEEYGNRYHLGWAKSLLGEINVRTRPAEAESLFQEAINIFSEIEAENPLALAYSGMGRFHKQKTNTEEAREYLTKALEIFERLGTLIEPDKVREELAELPE
jgi:tetratricopeptide (TPR) repeat protein